MAQAKTRVTDVDVHEFLGAVTPERKRADAYTLVAMMERLTGRPPHMWGPSIVGFGTYHYRYASGHEGDAPLAGFSPRKAALTVYILAGFEGYEALLAKLGSFKSSKACLYIKKLEDVDLDVLEQLVAESIAFVRATYEAS